ncbi:MAG: helix-turn-helix domain-containing protein [Catenulisporales bacterium]|nr:helix-turn-helix domain-containing protein [Catenulisporales bacterium]
MTTKPSSAAQQAREALGVRLRELRKDAGLTARVLAAQTGIHYTRVSKVENGIVSPSETEVHSWCRVCGAEDQDPDLIATLRAVESAYVEYRRQSRSGMKRVLGAHTPALYEQTQVFRIYEHNVVPGLFQTADYTRSMLEFWIRFLSTPNDIEEALAVRVQRQQVIYRPDKRFFVVLEEQALRTWFGSAEVQAGQLDRLLTVMSLPNVSLGIIPLMVERNGVASAGFWIFDDLLVALETPTAGIEVTRPQEIALYVRMFDHMKVSAVYGASARALITRASEETMNGREYG